MDRLMTTECINKYFGYAQISLNADEEYRFFTHGMIEYNLHLTKTDMEFFERIVNEDNQRILPIESEDKSKHSNGRIENFKVILSFKHNNHYVCQFDLQKVGI